MNNLSENIPCGNHSGGDVPLVNDRMLTCDVENFDLKIGRFGDGRLYTCDEADSKKGADLCRKESCMQLNILDEPEVKDLGSTITLYEKDTLTSYSDEAEFEMWIAAAKDIASEGGKIIRELAVEMEANFSELIYDVGRLFAKVEQEQEKKWNLLLQNLRRISEIERDSSDSSVYV